MSSPLSDFAGRIRWPDSAEGANADAQHRISVLARVLVEVDRGFDPARHDGNAAAATALFVACARACDVSAAKVLTCCENANAADGRSPTEKLAALATRATSVSAIEIAMVRATLTVCRRPGLHMGNLDALKQACDALYSAWATACGTTVATITSSVERGQGSAALLGLLYNARLARGSVQENDAASSRPIAGR